MGAARGALVGSGAGIPLAFGVDFVAGMAGSLAEQKIAGGRLSPVRSAVDGVFNAAGGRLYGTSPLRNAKDAFMRGALEGALKGGAYNIADEVNFDRDWIDDARRYLTNIVGKYGPQVQMLLKKAGGILDQIKFICPLHGPVWRKDLMYFIDKYNKWSKYEPEEKGVMIAYASMYGNTEAAAQALAAKLCEKGMSNVWVYDVSNTHVSQLVSEAFRLSHLVFASVTYNLGIYPVMHDFLMHLKALNFQKRTCAIIENGSWAVKSGDLMQKFLEEEMKNMTVLGDRLSLASSLPADKAVELDSLANAIIESMK